MTYDVAHVLVLACMLVLAGCSTSNTRRDLDVTGSLPRAIGLGAFAPTCVVFCFVSNESKQGDVAARDALLEEASELKVHVVREGEHTKGGARPKPKPSGGRK